MNYAIITWPESQQLMSETWYEEALLINDEGCGIYGNAAYLVPLPRIEKLGFQCSKPITLDNKNFYGIAPPFNEWK